jgi:sirohydrochlorin ferrochelatase
MADQPTLVAVAHGTKNSDGLAELRRLTNIVRTKMPSVPVELCYLDVVGPRLADTLAGLAGPAIVVPLLLATGHHVKTDIPAAIAGRTDTVVTDPIGPDPRISKVVQLRLEQARAVWLADDEDGAAPADVVVVAAGSSDPDARAELAEVADHLRAWNPRTVTFAQLTDDDPFATLSPSVQVANYLLAPGFFDDKLRGEASGGVVSKPIGAHPLVATVIVDRYSSGVRRLEALRAAQAARTSAIDE